MDIAIPLFDRFTALDAVGPYQVLSALPGARVRFLAGEAGPVSADNRMLTLVAEGPYENSPAPEILVVPGGIGTRDLMRDERVLTWVRSVHESSRFTTSVCTGSLVLGAAGILEGLDATTHWLERETLSSLGARAVPERVVEQGKVITAAGVSSGIDMALRLAELIAGPDVAQAIQLGIEYDPQPPFDAGSPEKAPRQVVDLVRSVVERMETPAA